MVSRENGEVEEGDAHLELLYITVRLLLHVGPDLLDVLLYLILVISAVKEDVLDSCIGKKL